MGLGFVNFWGIDEDDLGFIVSVDFLNFVLGGLGDVVYDGYFLVDYVV